MPAFAASAPAHTPRTSVRAQAAPKAAAPKPVASFAAAAALSLLLSAAPAMAGQGVTGGGIKTQVRAHRSSGLAAAGAALLGPCFREPLV